MGLPGLSRKYAARRAYRAEHVKDILDLLAPHLKIPLAECRLLDMGCGTGTICVPASRVVKSVVAVDSDPRLLAMSREFADTRASEDGGGGNLEFRNTSLFDLPRDSFDIVVCSDVIEHVEDHHGVAAAIARSLGPQGVYYLTTNNRWWPMEGHYGLPLLSWLPQAWADRYVRFMGLGSRYVVFPLSLDELTGLLARHGLAWSLVPPVRPHTWLYRLGKRLVVRDPSWWKFANAFQVVGMQSVRPRPIER